MDPVHRREAFEVATGRTAGRFARVEPRLRAERLVLGLLSDLPHENCWTIAERAGRPPRTACSTCCTAGRERAGRSAMGGQACEVPEGYG
jgi:hypothetical protein